ncbi:hypothetical protein FSP39_017731 [Pinctada imbricata]|uniref:Prominin-1-A n=1 Tax=Pinctada imbricata TaxID=66713 RepID=A0AA88Y6Y3_PINIB|nr:hypothetical protein FSP39_017731 [Pinctada imbricata]
MIIFCVCLLFLVPWVGEGDGATISDAYGNTAYDNGTVVWGSVPAGQAYQTVNTYDEGGLGTLFAFARSFVNTVQPNPFPFDLIKQVLNGEFDISAQYMELINFAMGFGICFVIGLLYVIFLPLCGCCFCCCRCCGNCGGDMKQKFDENEDCKRMGLAQALFLMALCMGASAACTYITNDRFTVALNYADSSVSDNLNDIQSYINNTIMQFKFVAIDMFTIVAQALIRDISGIGAVLTPAIFSVLNIDPVINAVIALDTNVNQIDAALDQVISDLNALQNATDGLTTDLNTLKTDIDTTKTGCSSDCTPTTACDSFDTSQLAVSADFSSLPDLSSTQSAIKSVVAQNLTGIALAAKSALDDMENTINSSTSSIQSSLQSSFDSFQSTLNTMTNDLEAQVQGAIDTTNLKMELGSFFRTSLDYDVYRQYFGYGLMGLFSLLPILLLLGICCGCCCLGKDTKPTKRGCCSSCGGCLMILAVAIMFLLGALLMLLTTISFMIGGNFEKICQTMFDLTLFKDFIDTGGIPGFALGTMLLNDPSINISLYNVLLGCRANKAPFELLYLNSLVPIDDYLNYSQYTGDIDTQMNSITTSVDLSSFTVLTPDMDNSLNDFKNSGIDNINFTSINDTLSQNIVTIDLTSIINGMTSIRNMCNNPTQSRWDTHISDTTTIRDVTLPDVEAKKAALQSSMGTLENAISGVTANIDNVRATAQDADDQIQNNVTAVLTDVANTYKTKLLGYVDSYINRTRYLIYNELAACLPLWNLYDSFTTTLCKYMVDALNGFWFGTGWGLVFFVPVIIVAVKTSKYYRKMKKSEGYGEDSDDEDEYDSDDDDYDYNYAKRAPRPEAQRYPQRYNQGEIW